MKYCLFSLLFFIAACNQTNNDMLCGKWKATNLHNPKMEKAIAQARADIDTLGNNDADMKKAVNVDSFRALSKKLLELDIAEQQKAFEQITYEFTKNGIAYLSDGVGKDSAKWSIENKNELTVDAPALTGIGDVQLFYIKHLSADALTLQMIEGTDTSEMELKKVK
jgi:uridine phosphorylase